MKSSIHFLLVLLGISQHAAAVDFNVSTPSFAYTINGTIHPNLTLVRGRTYTFAISASGHPFWIKTSAVTGAGSAFTNGVTSNGITSGTLTFAVPADAPNSLSYICEYHGSMKGTLQIINPPAASARLSQPRWNASYFQFEVAGTIGRQHVIEATTNLSSGWVKIGTNSVPSGSFTFTDSNAATLPNRFYRVLTE
jgi:hypothetical protein